MFLSGNHLISSVENTDKKYEFNCSALALSSFTVPQSSVGPRESFAECLLLILKKLHYDVLMSL